MYDNFKTVVACITMVPYIIILIAAIITNPLQDLFYVTYAFYHIIFFYISTFFSRHLWYIRLGLIFCAKHVYYNFEYIHILGLLLTVLFEFLLYYLTSEVYTTLFINIPYDWENQKYYVVFWMAWILYVILLSEFLFIFVIDYICFQSTFTKYILQPEVLEQFLEDIFYSTFNKKISDPRGDHHWTWLKVRNLFFNLAVLLFWMFVIKYIHFLYYPHLHTQC